LFENASSEICARENGIAGVLSMGFGVLSGKFLSRDSHPKQDLVLFPQYSRYSSEQATAATKLYQEIAQKNGFKFNRVVLAFIEQNLFDKYYYWCNKFTSVKENIETINVTLSEDILNSIDAVQAIIPDPAP
jgi:aryl-alcohol dehydrogenase-like predicted oxidoreductase